MYGPSSLFPLVANERVEAESVLTCYNPPSFVLPQEVFVKSNSDQQIVPGITVTASGLATVDPSVSDVLIDLAINLEEPTDLPVDVEHVLAAIVLAARQGELDCDAPLATEDPVLIGILTRHVKTIFEMFGGNVGSDD